MIPDDDHIPQTIDNLLLFLKRQLDEFDARHDSDSAVATDGFLNDNMAARRAVVETCERARTEFGADRVVEDVLKALAWRFRAYPGYRTEFTPDFVVDGRG